MVAMGVGDEDMGDPLVGEARQQCRDMLFELGAGIDHRDLALADDIGAGALEGERARIARDDAADPRRHPLEPAVFEREFAAIGNVDSHEFNTSDPPSPGLTRASTSSLAVTHDRKDVGGRV